MAKKKTILSRIKITHLIILILLIMGNTFAWMIYANKVTTGIDVHVRTWNVDFQDKDGTMVENSFSMEVNNIYPGMDDFEEGLDITNTGEIDGELSFVVLYARILEDEYYSVEALTQSGQEPGDDDLTSDEIIDMLENDFPFHITFTQSSDEIAIEETEEFRANITWAYESNNDELDTLWGNNAYHFKEDNPTLASIELTVVVRVKQKADS